VAAGFFDEVTLTFVTGSRSRATLTKRANNDRQTRTREH
jgi:hypothetical protein